MRGAKVVAAGRSDNDELPAIDFISCGRTRLIEWQFLALIWIFKTLIFRRRGAWVRPRAFVAKLSYQLLKTAQVFPETNLRILIRVI